MGEGTDHNTVNEAGKYTRGITDRLAAANLGSGIAQINRMAAQLPEANLKRGSGTGRSLGEQHSQSFALQILVRLTGLLLTFQFFCHIKNCCDLAYAKVMNRNQVFVF